MEKEVDKRASKRGKRNRTAGRRFEAKVREDLENNGWIVDKWMNNVDLEKDKICPAKRRYNPYLRALSIGNGFPDFFCFKRTYGKYFEVLGIEVKRNGSLDKDEKERLKWYVDNNIFSKVLIAKEIRKEEDKRKTEIEYVDFSEEYEEKNGRIVKIKKSKKSF